MRNYKPNLFSWFLCFFRVVVWPVSSIVSYSTTYHWGGLEYHQWHMYYSYMYYNHTTNLGAWTVSVCPSCFPLAAVRAPSEHHGLLSVQRSPGSRRPEEQQAESAGRQPVEPQPQTWTLWNTDLCEFISLLTPDV